MIGRFIECDLCNCTLYKDSEDDWYKVRKTFYNIKLSLFKKYQICEDCRNAIVEKVREKRIKK